MSYYDNVAPKDLALGTALWGWLVPKTDAFRMLDLFIENGNFSVDCATNYPINGNPESHGIALKWLKEWADKNSLSSMKINVKIGSVDNLGTSKLDLSRQAITTQYLELKNKLRNNLDCISVHWDNRERPTIPSVEFIETLESFKEIKNSGLNIGFSGVYQPHQYLAGCDSLKNSWVIQCKENLLTSAARIRYQKSFPNCVYYAYGINMGGVKFTHEPPSQSLNARHLDDCKNLMGALSELLKDQDLFDIPIHTFSELSLALTFGIEEISGIIIGPSSAEQLTRNLSFIRRLHSETSREKVARLRCEVKKLVSDLHIS